MFKSLDFLYVPAPDIESSVQYYTEVLGGKLLWKIHAYGSWVACIALSRADQAIAVRFLLYKFRWPNSSIELRQ